MLRTTKTNGSQNPKSAPAGKSKPRRVIKSKRRKERKQVLPVAEKREIVKLTKAEVKKELKRIDKAGLIAGGESLLKLVTDSYDIKANSGQAVAFPFNTQAFSIFVQTWVDRMCMMTPICTTAGGLAPVDLAMFAWMAVILHIRKSGQLTGDTISLIPSFAEDISIPVPLANMVAYFGKYMHMDQNFTTAFQLPNNFMNAMLNFSELDPAKLYPFPVYNGGLLYDLMYNGGITELVANRTWTAISVAQWCSTRLYLVSNQLKALNIATVPSVSIPKYAPGIEAYCCRGIDQNSATVIPNRVFSLVAPVDWELATILSVGSLRVVQQTWRSAPISSPSINTAFRYATLTTEHYLMAGCMFLLMAQGQFKPGRIKDVYRLGRSPISTFAWNIKNVFGINVKTLLAANYVQLQEQIPDFNDEVTPGLVGFRALYVLHTLACLHLHHRVEMNSPITNLALKIDGTVAHSATAFYNEGVSDAVSLPAAIVEFIESLGVVISDGAMVFPHMFSNTGAASNTWGDPTFTGNLITMSWKGLNQIGASLEIYPFAWGGVTTLVPQIDTGTFIWDASFQLNYYASTPSFPYPIQHPQMSVNNFAEMWKGITGQQFYNGLALAMVHSARLKTIRFGEPYQMLSVASSSAVRRINLYPKYQELSATHELGSATPAAPLTVNAPVVTYIGTSMVLNRAEAVQATILPSAIDTIDLAASTSTFLCKMTSTNSYLMLEEAINRVTQSGLNNTTLTLGRQSTAPASLKQLPGGEIVPLKAKDNAGTPSAWDQTINEVGSRLLPPAVGTAASFACDFIPFIGAFIAPLCAAGASAIASTLVSRGTVTGQHLTEQSSADPVKSALSGVSSGIAKLGSSLNSSGEAINGARSIVTKFALAQVKGLDYAGMAAHAAAQ